MGFSVALNIILGALCIYLVFVNCCYKNAHSENLALLNEWEAQAKNSNAANMELMATTSFFKRKITSLTEQLAQSQNECKKYKDLAYAIDASRLQQLNSARAEKGGE